MLRSAARAPPHGPSSGRRKRRRTDAWCAISPVRWSWRGGWRRRRGARRPHREATSSRPRRPRARPSPRDRGPTRRARSGRRRPGGRGRSDHQDRLGAPSAGPARNDRRPRRGCPATPIAPPWFAPSTARLSSPARCVDRSVGRALRWRGCSGGGSGGRRQTCRRQSDRFEMGTLRCMFPGALP